MSSHFGILFFVIMSTLLFPFCSPLAIATNQTKAAVPVTCNPAPPFAFLLGAQEEVGFDVCLFDSTGNLVTNTMAAVGNILWSLQNLGAYFIGSCQCRQDCNPSQIVCKDPDFLTSILPEEFQFSILNGIAQLIYQGNLWTFYCYCPSHVKNGVDPCVRPASPDFCAP